MVLKKHGFDLKWNFLAFNCVNLGEKTTCCDSSLEYKEPAPCMKFYIQAEVSFLIQIMITQSHENVVLLKGFTQQGEKKQIIIVWYH